MVSISGGFLWAIVHLYICKAPVQLLFRRCCRENKGGEGDVSGDVAKDLKDQSSYEDEGRKWMVVTKVVVPASDCEIVDDGQVTLKELNEFEAKGYEAKNSKDLWISKELENIKRDLGLPR